MLKQALLIGPAPDSTFISLMMENHFSQL